LALRKTSTVKAGVQVGGTLKRPVVKLYSDPTMPTPKNSPGWCWGMA